MIRSLFRFAAPLALALTAGSLLASEPTTSWPEFRGPTGDGHANAAVPLEWSEAKNVRWKTAIRGRAWSTPVIHGDQVWLSTATADGTELSAVCVDGEDGQILFDKVLFRIDDPRPLGNGVNCYGSPSPAIEAGRVFIGFGSYGTACLDTKTFERIWERRDLPCNHFRGPASSLVHAGDTIVTHMDGSDHQYVIALDKKTGKTRWKTERSTDYGDLGADGKPRANGDFRKAFNTPLVVETTAGAQLLSPGAKAAFAYDPRTGKEIWTVRYKNHSTASRPVYGAGVAYINTGYPKSELWAVRVDGKGDVTDSHVLWKRSKSVPNRSSPLLVDGALYMCTDRGIVSRLDTKTGEAVWQERIGGAYSSSPVYANGRIYFFSERGVTTVCKPGMKLEVLAKNELDGGFMASPAIAGKAFFLRTKTHLYRVEEE